MRGAVLALALGVAGCTTIPQSPAQNIYAMKLTLLGAVGVATSYARLPRCPKAEVCSDQATVVRIDAAAHAASSALDVAEQFASSASGGAKALAAESAVLNLVSLVQTIKAKP